MAPKESPYSKREIDQLLKASDEKALSYHNAQMQRMDVFESNTSTTLEEIKIQTTKTNGSVAALKQWRAYITGAVVMLAFFIGVIAVPVIAAFIQKSSL